MGNLSFVLDPPLLVASGAIIERTLGDETRAGVASRTVVGIFVGFSLALYANAPGLGSVWRLFGARSGREFMLTSGLARIQERDMGTAQHAAALAQFALYPLWLTLGRALARR